MDSVRDTTRWCYLVAVVLLAGVVFSIDVATLLGEAGSLLYVAVLLVALIWLSQREMLVAAVVFSGLTVLGFFVSSALSGTQTWTVITNRLLVMFAIWVTVILGRRRKDFADGLRAARNALAHRIEQRTAQVPLTVNGLSAEIAKREHSEKALRESELRFSLLIEGVKDYAIFMLDPSGRVISWNSGAERIYGYTAEEIIGQSFSRFFTPQDIQSGNCEDELATASAEGSLQREATRVRKDNSQFLAHLLTTALYDESGALRGFAKVTRDITQERRLQERLLQAERLAAMAEAMAGLSHESRNALQRSQASLERLARRLKDQPQSHELISNIQQAQDDLYRLYEEVREFAKPIRIRAQWHDVHQVLRDAWRQLAQARKGRRAKLRDHSAGIEWQCEIDVFAVRQVFRNILENSLAACDDPVEIDVDYSPALIRDRPAVRIALRDNGPGLDQQQQEQIFDAFYTTKTHGTGLGMAIAQRIVEAHGGQIVVSQGNHQGAEIQVTLPRRQE